MKTVLIINENRGFGGAEVHTLQLARGLVAHLPVHLVVPPDSWLAGQLEGLSWTGMTMKSELDPVAITRLHQLYRAQKVGLVHSMANRDLVLATLALPPALLKAEHSYLDPHRSKLFDWAYRRAEVRVTVSRALAEQAGQQLGLQPEAFTLVANGLAPERFQGVAPHPELEEGRWLGTVSALRPEKGQADLLRVFSKLQKEFPDLGLVLAGEGPERSHLEQLAAGLKVKFLGQVKQPESVLAGLEIAVVPSHKETFSLVCLEAMAMGKPLVASRTGGIPEVVGDTAWLYSPGDLEGLESQLLDCLQHPRQQAERARRRFLEHFTLERMIEAYLEIYAPFL